MNLERLALFLQIVESGSVNRAARRVHLTQPALSRNLKLLEEELRVDLFRRKGRGLELTAAGRALAAQARELLARVEQTELAVSRSAERAYFDVRLGAVDSATTYLLPDALERLGVAFPRLVVDLRVGRSSALLEQLRRGQLDLAVVASSGAPAEVRNHNLGHYELAYFGRADRFAELASAKRFSELERFPVAQIEAAPGQASVVPEPSLSRATASNVASVKSLVLTGFGIGDLPDFVLTPEERRRLARAGFALDPDCGLFLAGSSQWNGKVEEAIETTLADELRATLAARQGRREPAGRKKPKPKRAR